MKLSPSDFSPLVAVAGNPNAGKTTLFNVLTGSQQKVGNYPGVTVEKVEGSITHGGQRVRCVDVPGIYSLDAASEDERVAVEVIVGLNQETPDLLVYVVDAGNLERNLFLFSQLADREIPTVVALALTDVAKRRGIELDEARLGQLLGVDVVRVVAHKGIGVSELKEAILRNLDQPRRPSRDFGYPMALETKVAAVRERLARSGFDVARRDVRRALLGEENEFVQGVAEVEELRQAFELAKEELAAQGVVDPSVEVSTRYQWASMVQKAVTQSPEKRVQTTTDKLDYWLTHRVFGLLVFTAVMYGVFQAIYTFANPLMGGIETAFAALGGWVGGLLEPYPLIQSAIVDGLIAGVGSMVIFLPQILILFLLIAILEGTGYLARAAFLMDRLLGWCGLNGRAFIPLLSSFACAVPGIMSARVMPDPKSRLATILVAPLMSCSARLPVYILLIGAFIEPRWGAGWAGFALFAMHLLGLAVAIPIVWVLNRGVIKGKRLPFLLELPPYQWPKARDVWIAIYARGRIFVKTAGTIIVALSIVIWALTYFPRHEGSAPSNYEGAAAEQYLAAQQLENSYMGQFGKALEPAFVPAGFDWRLTTAIIAAFPARELVIAQMGIVFNLGAEQDEASGDLRSAMKEATWPDGRKLITPWTAVGFMVFFALCCQCMATLAAIKRETNSWKWPAFVFTYMTVLAYLGAVAVNQLAQRFG